MPKTLSTVVSSVAEPTLGLVTISIRMLFASQWTGQTKSRIKVVIASFKSFETPSEPVVVLILALTF